jgi:RNA polymerase sigma-70 factor (ECF subfamily)
MGLVVHVITHTANSRAIEIAPQDRDDLAAEVFLEIVAGDFAALRHFRGQCSLATYLTVIARRVVVRELLKRRSHAMDMASDEALGYVPDEARAAQEVLSDREQVQRLLNELEGVEADVVRLYHLEGKSYYEISMATGMPENSIGPMLSRARGKLRKASADSA